MGLFTPENHLQYLDDYISKYTNQMYKNYVAKHDNARGVVGGRKKSSGLECGRGYSR